jgi:Tol biopolymer transport system component
VDSIEPVLSRCPLAEPYNRGERPELKFRPTTRQIMQLAAGSRLGPYEIVGPLGAGGMGQVYCARDTRLHRDVAIKVLPPSVARDPERRARFEREAQAIAALSHPNVLAIHDTGSHDGELFVVTELLEGETLTERLKAGPLPIRKALDLAVQIARGLAAAHDKHIVHRDLKPENLFLLRDGRIKILDFGLARYTPSAAGVSETVPAISDPGLALGTVGYMAPEQVRGQPLDARADLFAFGAVLYEMLTGQRAFRRDTAAETLTAILRDDPPEAPLSRADLSPALERIVQHCLEKDPAERFQSARDVGFALEALSGAGGVAPTGSGARATVPAARLSPSMAVFATAAVAVAAAITWYIWGRGDGDRGAPAVITLGTATQVTADAGLEIDPAISPDGRFIAYSAGSAGRMRIYIRPVSGGRTLPLTDDPAAFEYQPRFSPDGSQILFVTPAGAFVASAFGGTARRMAAGRVRWAAWSPDGTEVAVSRDTGAVVVSADGNRERPLEIDAKFEIHSCVWAPTNRWFACVSGNHQGVIPGRTFGNIAPSRIVLLPVSGGTAIDVTTVSALHLSPIWSADGRSLYFVSNRRGPHDIFVMEVPDDGRVRGEPTRVTTGLGVMTISMAQDGRRLAYATYSARSNLWSLPIPARGPVDTSAARPLTSDTQIIEAVAVSRDGKWLLFDSNRFGNGDIFRMPVAGGPVERLTTDPVEEFAPELSPDGLTVAYHSFGSGTRDLFIRSIEGAAIQITRSPNQESYPAWSPNGRSLAYYDQVPESGATRGLFVMRRDGDGWSTPIGIRTGTSYKAYWIDDRTVVYPRGRSVEAVDVTTRATRVLYTASGADDPVASGVVPSHDGGVLYIKSHDHQQQASFWSLPIAGGRPTLLVRFTDPLRESTRRDFAVGAGQFFFTLEDRQADIWVAEVLPPRR